MVGTSLEKTEGFPFTRGLSVAISFFRNVRLGPFPPLCAWTPSGLNSADLVHVATVFVTSVHQSSCVWMMLFPWSYFPPLALIIFLLHLSLECGGEEREC